MAVYNKFNPFVEHLVSKVHDLLGASAADMDAINLYLSNAPPDAAADAVKADLAEISTGNGYTAGGTSIAPISGTRTTGTYTFAATDKVWTASGGAIAQFRYVVLFNNTPSSPLDPLIAWWDYGSAVDVGAGETFTVDFGAQVFTLA